MVERNLNIVNRLKNDAEITDEKIKEINSKFEGVIQSIDGIWYKCVKCRTEKREKRDNEVISHLMMESVEGKELEEILSKEREQDGITLLNIPAFIYGLNEEYKDIVGIFPLQNGEQFSRFLTDDLELEEDYIEYPEKLEQKITFDEEDEEWRFSVYKWLVKIRKEISCGYSEGYYALTDLNNMNKISYV